LCRRGPSSLARLATALEVNPSTALRVVERLTTAGMVEKATNPARRHEVRLRLTGAGWQTVRQVNEHRRTFHATTRHIRMSLFGCGATP
jgi:DNA-binding MarR family transcriptional regulator